MNWQTITFDWNQARAFLVTAEEGSLSAAPRALGLTQPTLSRQVAALEETLGVTLFQRVSKSLILTEAAGGPGAKGTEAVAARLAALGMTLTETLSVPHDVAPLARAIAAATGEIVLILTASATSDVRDTAPAALARAGGRLIRFGMPVDPGNLLFLGEIGARPVIGLPGSARSPVLHGADWVLARVACGLPCGAAEIAAMGVGGLLKEIPTRPQPRRGPRG